MHLQEERCFEGVVSSDEGHIISWVELQRGCSEILQGVGSEASFPDVGQGRPCVLYILTILRGHLLLLFLIIPRGCILRPIQHRQLSLYSLIPFSTLQALMLHPRPEVMLLLVMHFMVQILIQRIVECLSLLVGLPSLGLAGLADVELAPGPMRRFAIPCV